MSEPWFIRSNWVGRSLDDADSKEITPDLWRLYERAAKLSLPELAEVSAMAGTQVVPLGGEKYANPEDYIYTLDETDHLDEVLAYLDAHGV